MILDTNALSAVAEGEPAALAEFSRARELGLPVIVLGEFRFGIAQSRRRRQYESWLRELIALAGVLAITEETTLYYAEIRAELKRSGTPIPSNDIWIAALGRQHASPILSRDRHFDSVRGLKRIGW